MREAGYNYSRFFTGRSAGHRPGPTAFQLKLAGAVPGVPGRLWSELERAHIREIWVAAVGLVSSLIETVENITTGG